MKESKENLVVNRSFEFALNIVAFCELLNDERKFIVSNQLLRAGTSIGANIREAQSAESRQDFIHKLKIAAKEIEETEYWLLICKYSVNYPNSDALLEKVNALKLIVSKIIGSAKKNA